MTDPWELLTITAVPGILAGHATDRMNLTGVTAVLCPGGATVAADVRGGAPGTHETDLCRPGHLVTEAQGVVMSGGSAFGLAAANGAMRWLSERGHGFPTAAGPVPIVPAAVVFDLAVGEAVPPDADMGYAACSAAMAEPLAEGNVGAGTGCSAGKFLSAARATKAGLGSAAVTGVAGRWTVGAVAAVNPAGEVRDPETGRIIAGVRRADGPGFVPLTELLLSGDLRADALPGPGQNTVVAVIATDAALSKEDAWRVAAMAHAGIARTVYPCYSPFDGDTVFVLATGRAAGRTDALAVARLGAAASLALSRAILRGVRTATAAGGLPAAGDLSG